MKYLFLLFLLLFVEMQAMPAQVIIIRSGEQIPNVGSLSQKGLERAGALAAYFLQTPSYGPLGTIFAGRPSLFGNDNTTCCIQTVTPTATASGLPVHSPYAATQENKLADLILSNDRYDGQNVLICWYHDKIFDLIEAFGYTPPIASYPDCCYDYTFVMTFPIGAPAPVATILHQDLLYGDPEGTCSFGTCLP